MPDIEKIKCNKTGSIYIIKNKNNDKVYIGQTTLSVKERFNAHKKRSTLKNRNYKIYNAMRKYGVETFYVETIEENIPLNMLDEKEIYYIKKYNSFENGYNSTSGGDGRTINCQYDEHKMLEMAKSGIIAEEIAKEFNCNKATIFRTLHKLGFYYHKQPNEKEIKNLVLSNKTYKEISGITGIPIWTVERFCQKNNISKRNKYVKYRKDFNEKDVIFDYISNVKIKDICEKYNINEKTIYNIKKRNNIPNRPQVYKYKTFYR